MTRCRLTAKGPRHLACSAARPARPGSARLGQLAQGGPCLDARLGPLAARPTRPARPCSVRSRSLGSGRPDHLGHALASAPRLGRIHARSRVHHSRTRPDKLPPGMAPGVPPRPAQRQRGRTPRHWEPGHPRSLGTTPRYPAHRTPDTPQRLRPSLPTSRPSRHNPPERHRTGGSGTHSGRTVRTPRWTNRGVRPSRCCLGRCLGSVWGPSGVPSGVRISA